MATLRKDWVDPSGGICPKCFYKTRLEAIRNEMGWQLEARCNCRNINVAVPWPFEEGILEPDSNDLDRLGFSISLDPSYEALWNEHDDAYLDDVDHGWEDAFHDSFMDQPE